MVLTGPQMMASICGSLCSYVQLGGVKAEQGFEKKLTFSNIWFALLRASR